jgi:hypothetical protein
MPSSQSLAATPNGGYTSSRQLKLKRHSWQCNSSLVKMMSISFAFSYLLSCHAFRSSWSLTSSGIATRATSRTSINVIAHPSSRQGVGRQFRTIAVVVQGQKDNVEIEHGDFSRKLAKCCSISSLFPQRQSSTRRRSMGMQPIMMMAANDSSPTSDNTLSNEVSSHSPLHVKVWNSLRSILARLWVSNFYFPLDKNYSASTVLSRSNTTF